MPLFYPIFNVFQFVFVLTFLIKVEILEKTILDFGFFLKSRFCEGKKKIIVTETREQVLINDMVNFS